LDKDRVGVPLIWESGNGYLRIIARLIFWE